MTDDRPILTLAHSPDPDDAFMWWPLGDVEQGREPEIDTWPFRFRTEPADIESLNRRAEERGDLDITALSAAAYARVAGRYALTACGASMGEGYGPKVVAREAHERAWLSSDRITVVTPGARTTAHLTFRILAGPNATTIEAPFREVTGRVLAARGDGPPQAGIVIHEGQLTYAEEGLAQVADLGAWWLEREGLPLPLGVNAVRRDLESRFGRGTLSALAGVLRRSVEHAASQRSRGLEVALGFARGITREQADEFVGMYVTARTIDMGEEGETAIGRLLSLGAASGLCPEPGVIDVVR